MSRIKLIVVVGLVVAASWLSLTPLDARRQPSESTDQRPQVSGPHPGALTLAETIRRADAIVLGTIISRQSRWGDASRRWMVTDYFMAVEDIVQASEKGDAITPTLVLPYWGGTMGDETQSIADVRLPQVGERLLVMLRPDWQRQIGIPVVGFNQGMFPVEAGSTTFVEWLRANVASIKRSAAEVRRQLDPNDPRMMRTFSKVPEVETPRPSSRQPSTPPSRSPAIDDGAGDFTLVSAPASRATHDVEPVPAIAVAGGTGRDPKYSIGPKAYVPIVVNSFQSSFGPWYPEDQYQMSKWNYYANEVFRVFTNPTGTFRWMNGIFDLAGFPSSSAIQPVYGTTWEALGDPIGVTFRRFGAGALGELVILEADIALNPAYTYTLDDELLFNDTGNVVGFRHTMMHELGHMFGLDHNFNALSQMNYFPNSYRFFTMPYTDDAQAVRAAFPSIAVSRTDLGVYLYRASGYQDASPISLPFNVIAGTTFQINDYTIENVGTTTIEVPTVEWYLTSRRNFSGSYYYLGTKTYSPPLPPFSQYTPTLMMTTLAVPANVTPGDYFLAAYVRNDGGASQASFPFSNNNAFSRSLFTVLAPLPGAFAKENPANGVTGESTSPALSWTSSSGAAAYQYCIDTVNNGVCDAAWTSSLIPITWLLPGTTYYWQVRAVNGTGYTYADAITDSVSIWWRLTTEALPGAFNKTAPANGALNQPLTTTIGWTSSGGTIGYQYCYDTTNDAACAPWYNTGATSVAIGGLAPNTTYYWHVRSVNAGGTTYADGNTNAFSSFKTRRRAVPIVDLSGDGKGDALTYDPETGAWVRRVSDGSGGFSTSSGTFGPGWSITPADFNNDLLTDLFLFDAASGQWARMTNDGAGFAADAGGVWWPGWERHVTDLDGDGLSDLFLYDPATGIWFKCLTTPTGFTYLQGGWNPGWEIHPMQLNADGLGDFFLISRTTGRWFWVLGQAGSGFTYPVTETWYTGWAFYPGDFNGDGVTDLLLHDPPTGTYFVAMTGASGFSYQQGGWSLGWTPWVADFNADGKDDLLLHDAATGVWFQMLGNGSGGFTSAGSQVWSLGWQLHFTDLNADGRADVVLYDAASGTWYQARNFTLGSFSYTSGSWSSGLSLIVRPR